MLFSQKHRILFIHLSRTGGTSIRELLRELLPDALEGSANGLPQHATACEVASGFGPDFFGYYRFAFVRNPWDRLWSWYSMRCVATGDDRLSFDEFLNLWIPSNGPLILPNQMECLTSVSGEFLVNTVGRYENYAADLVRIFAQAALPRPFEFPRLNQSGAGHYSRFYSDAGRDLVERAYRADLEHFDYRYESL